MVPTLVAEPRILNQMHGMSLKPWALQWLKCFYDLRGKTQTTFVVVLFNPSQNPSKTYIIEIASKLARPTTIKRCHVSLSIWGCIETWHAIFGRMNIHKSQLCWCWPRHYCFDSKPYLSSRLSHRNQQQLSRNPSVVALSHILDVVVFLFMCQNHAKSHQNLILTFKYLK